MAERTASLLGAGEPAELSDALPAGSLPVTGSEAPPADEEQDVASALLPVPSVIVLPPAPTLPAAVPAGALVPTGPVVGSPHKSHRDPLQAELALGPDAVGPVEVIELANPALPDVAGTLGATAPPVPFQMTPAMTPVPTAAPIPVPMLIPTAFVDTGRPDWPQPLAESIHWQLDSGLQEARIELAPEGLGALELHVQVEDGQVQLHIGAAHAATRELLGEALPRLRELLGDSGLSLGQATVSSQQQRPNPSQPLWKSASTDDADSALETPAIKPLRRSRGLFDHYA